MPSAAAAAARAEQKRRDIQAKLIRFQKVGCILGNSNSNNNNNNSSGTATTDEAIMALPPNHATSSSSVLPTASPTSPSSSGSDSAVISAGATAAGAGEEFWDDILYRLKHNELVELRLGWYDSGYVPTHRRALQSLAKALRSNTSLRRINIGWKDWNKHYYRRDLLEQVLYTLADSIRPQQLQSIALCLTNDVIPDHVLARLLQSQTSLSSLTLQTVTTTTADSTATAAAAAQHDPASIFAVSEANTNSTRSTESNVSYSSVGTTGSSSSSSHAHVMKSFFWNHNASSSSSSSSSSKKKSKNHNKKKQVTPFLDAPSLSSKNKSHNNSSSKTNDDSTCTVVPVLLNAWLPNHSYQVLSELRLMDCELTDRSLYQLAEQVLPTTILSIRGNRHVTGYGAAALIRAAKASCLDLSLCDFNDQDCTLIAQALRDVIWTTTTTTPTSSSSATAVYPARSTAVGSHHPSAVATATTGVGTTTGTSSSAAATAPPLQELWLRGNYRMELTGIQEIMAVAPWAVQSLDISYCDVSEEMTVHVFETLSAATATASSTTTRRVALRHLKMHGCQVRSDRATNALVELLGQAHCGLTTLAVDDSKNARKYLTATQMGQIAQALETNFELEELRFDFFTNINEQQQWRRIEFWLTLNRGGRRLLRPSSSVTTPTTNTTTALANGMTTTTKHGKKNQPWALSSSSSFSLEPKDRRGCTTPAPASVTTTTAATTKHPPTTTTTWRRNVEKARRNDMNDWIQLLEVAKTAPGIDSIYWVVTHSVDRFCNTISNNTY